MEEMLRQCARDWSGSTFGGGPIVHELGGCEEMVKVLVMATASQCIRREEGNAERTVDVHGGSSGVAWLGLTFSIVVGASFGFEL